MWLQSTQSIALIQDANPHSASSGLAVPPAAALSTWV
jgi:hypothetical protein